MPALATRGPVQKQGWEYFAATGTNQRRYEALRACFGGGASIADVAERFGDTRSTMASLVRAPYPVAN
jgi:hypothetical protein